MKKLLLILLCLIVVTGCGNEVEQQPNKPNIKQEEVEIKKYITIKIKLNEDCDPTIKESCKVKDYKVENDIKNIFKDLDLNGSTYCLMNKQFCSEDIFNTSTLKQIYDIAIKNNLNFIPDYRYLVDDKYKTIREIIIKPLDELKFDGRINLNENVVATFNIEYYNELEERCMYTDKDLGKEQVMSWCDREQGGIKKRISDELINQVNSTPGRKYLGKGGINEIGYESIIISSMQIPNSPRFYREPSFTTWINDRDKGIASGDIGQIYKGMYNDEAMKFMYNPFNINNDMDSTPGRTETKILDEKLCEEYKLTCDRW